MLPNRSVNADALRPAARRAAFGRKSPVTFMLGVTGGSG